MVLEEGRSVYGNADDGKYSREVVSLAKGNPGFHQPNIFELVRR